MFPHGLIRVAAACPELRVGDTAFNIKQVLELLTQAEEDGINLVVFPEMGLTGYTCYDLFHTLTLQKTAEAALLDLVKQRVYGGMFIVGLPLAVGGQLFNCAAVIAAEKLLGIIPKSYLPNYKEFYDARYYAPGRNAEGIDTVLVGGQEVNFGTDLLFKCRSCPDFVLGIEICEDLWTPIPPSSRQALAGATVIANLSASNEIIGKSAYRKQLVACQSGRCLCGYVYAAAGVGESTTDLVFGGHCLIAENGAILAELARFERDSRLLVADLDLERIRHDRIQNTTFNDNRRDDRLHTSYTFLDFQIEAGARKPESLRAVDAHPFVPGDALTLKDRCDEIFHTQVAGLAKRLGHIGSLATSIGVSGGLDSTLALLVACKTMDALEAPRDRIHAYTLPGFGTTVRTKTNALVLMKSLGVTAYEIDIREICFNQMKALGHAPFGIPLAGETLETLSEKLRRLPKEKCNDLVFENVQARVRTSLLMNAGFVIGTGDLSELALGWCTYNADHMSMYNPNISIPKTLVKFLVRWAAENEFDGETRKTLLDVVATEISPELLPIAADGTIAQRTESTVGPYELVDFFLYHFLRWGAEPEKILYLARHARFERDYPEREVRGWLRLFFQRFFANQFKRSCLPDGPKVGTVSLSPRGDWRMPSDASAQAWLDSFSD